MANRDYVEEWVKSLGLQDWDITVVFDVNREDIKKIGDTEACGVTQWLTNSKSAYIAILGEKYYYDTPCLRAYDEEETVVHELLHCKFSILHDNMGDNQFMDDWLHQQIDDLARALVSAKRRANKRGGKK